MSVISSLSSSDWQILRDGPEWVFAALSAADGNVALTTKVKESKAFKNVLESHGARFSLVKEVLADNGKPAKEIKGATLSEAEQALQDLKGLLSAKTPVKDAAEYREFLIAIADSVAGAAGEGALRLGEIVSKNEEKAAP